MDPASLDEERYCDYVMERILELGDLDEVKWLMGRYGEPRLRQFLERHGHRLTARSAFFWARVFGAEPRLPPREKLAPWTP